METKRLILAFALSVVILLTWQVVMETYFPPPPPPPPGESQPQPGVEGEPSPGVPADSLAAPRTPDPETEAPLAVEQAQAEERIELDNTLFRVVFSNRGGRVLSWRLKQYTTREGTQLELLPEFNGHPGVFPLAVQLDDPELAARINDALYRVERTRLDDGERLSFVWSDGRLRVVKSLTFRDRSDMGAIDERDYLIDVALDVTDAGRPLRSRLVWGPGFGAQDPKADNSTYYYSGQVLWNRNGSVTRKTRYKVDPGLVVADLEWAGLEDQYFAVLFLPATRPVGFEVRVDELVRARPASANGDSGEDPEEVASVALSLGPEAQLFVGPKNFHMLRRLGHDLDSAVWFATNGFLAAVSKFVFLALVWVHDHTVANYGMAIVLTTFFLRLLLFPLNQYSMVSIKKSQMQMQRLQPKVNAIKNRYKKKKDAENRAKMNQEMMAMYKTEGVNPMGGLTGCLPMLAQFPILIGFYNMLTVAVELRGAPFFGWIQDLSQKDPYWITPLLMGVTMFLQQKMATSKVTDPMQRQQQRIMMFMPIFFTYICLQMPSGLVLYWFVNNILGIGQQWLVNRRTGRLEAVAQRA